MEWEIFVPARIYFVTTQTQIVVKLLITCVFSVKTILAFLT